MVIEMGWGWFGRWPGRGPWSHLPPWKRPGWYFGRGWGRGWCWWFFWPHYFPIPSYDLKTLEDYKRFLERELKEVEKRIEELKKGES